ncbi:MAG: choline dehydrogenase [Rhodothalassiaceae bacterium]|nr:MAG: choline dehydrogenase [Rhodothalassiaceae bacterium]
MAGGDEAPVDAGLFDYVIVGAGSAGAVIAARLSEDPGNRVLLLEAGPADRSPFFHMPLGYAETLKSTRYNWQFPTAPDPGTGGRVHKWPRGKALGGSSSINAMIYIRGNPGDYDTWRQLGCVGWGAEDVLPYFKRAEDYEHGAVPGHGVGGPLPVREPAYIHPFTPVILEAFEQAGLPRRADFNVGDQEGAGLCQFTIARGRRASTAQTYLKQARGRPNLEIRTEALAARVVIEDGRAVGVAYLRRGRLHLARARREVILSGGAVNSPQLLELSGIGDGARLNALGIPVVRHLPGVGENLQDHYSVGLSWALKPGTPSINTDVHGLGLLKALVRYLLRRDGVMAVGPAHITAFARTRPDLLWPDVQYHATPASLDAEAYQRNELVFHKEPGATVAVCVLRPESRGSIHATSADPTVYPEILPNYLDAESDRIATVEGLKLIRRVFATPAMQPHVAFEREPGALAQTDEELLDLARRMGTTIYHPVGTCRMGAPDDEMAVLTPDLKVKGVEGLRVADASVMPRLVSGNTNAPAIMIGEKAADLILGREPPAGEPWPEDPRRRSRAA